MENKIRKLQSLGFSLVQIEKQSGLGNGTLTRVLKSGKYRKTTERKIDNLIRENIKILVNIE